ncbi:MAG: glycosyltransferase family 39 protein [Planctomycetota bacterium]|jgi:hypothetical protein
MFESLFSILSLVVIALASYGLGRPVVSALGADQDDRLSTAVWSIAMGLVAAGTLLAAMGLAGGLYVPLIGALTGAACVWAVAQILSESAGNRNTAAEQARRFGGSGRLDDARWPPPPRWMRYGVIGLAAVACAASLATALAPPTAGDALCYHLELPKTFLLEHEIGFLPDSENSTFPLLVEMWFLWGLALDGGVAAQLVHWGAGLLLGLATVVLATPIIGRRWAWIAGAVVVLVPGVNNQMAAPLNDVALALLTTLALAAWRRAVVDVDGRRWAVIAGVMGGGALGTKYLALVFAAAVAVAAVWAFLRRPRQRQALAESAAVVAVVAISVGGLWYVRAAWHRGNPVYPFLSEVFTSPATETPDGHETLPESKAPMGRHPAGIAAAAWHVTMHPERFGGRGHQLGALFLVALPGLFFARRLRGLGSLLAVAAVYWVVWYLLRQNVRFLLPIVPLLAVSVVWIWIEVGRFPLMPRLVVVATLAGILAAGALVPLARCGDRMAVAVGMESRDDYLERHEPTWPAADLMGQLWGTRAHLLSQDYRAFHFPCRVTRESVYRRRTRYDRKITHPADLSRVLRDAGFTHLLLAENVRRQGIQYDPTLTRLAEAQRTAGGGDSLWVLAEYHFQDTDGGLRRYRLLMLR